MVHHTFSGHYALRADQWKFIPTRSGVDGSWNYQLYDLEKDPYEKHNLAHARPELVGRFDELLSRLISM